MGLAERKIREREEMKKLIIRAALDLYLNGGVKNTSIRKIAERINYSPSTIYLYFPGKDAIFFDMQKMAFDLLLESLRLVATQGSPYLKLRSLGRKYIDFGVSHPRHYDLIFTLRLPANDMEGEHVFKNFSETYVYMQGVMRECISAGKFKYTDLDTALLQYWSILHGLTGLYANNRLSAINRSGQTTLDFVYNAWDTYISSMAKK